MADEPKLSDLLQRIALEGKPFWGDTQWRGPSGLDYIPLPAKNSQMADFLLKAMTLAPMGLGAAGMRPPHAIPRNSLDPGITGGRPGYSHGPDQWSQHSIPADRNSSTGLATYNWHGMRNAATGERLPNPYPNAGRGIDMNDPVATMTRDIVGRLERGEIGAAEAQSLYEQAVSQQRAKQDLLSVLQGGQRPLGRPANDVE